MSTEDDNIGLELKNIRKDLKLSVTDMASMLKVSESYVSMIENGKRIPPFWYIDDLGFALDLEKQYVLDLKEKAQYSRDRETVELVNRGPEERRLIRYVVEGPLGEPLSIKLNHVINEHQRHC